MFNLQIFGLKFVKSGQFGDFDWMSKQNEHSDSLFIFNDNEEYHNTCKNGIGNAVMRKYNKYSNLTKPKSAGIPTGTLKNGGYQILNTHAKQQIDNAFDEIIDLVVKYKYKQIYYSSEFDGKLGTSIFDVNEKVVKYITHKLFTLSTNPIQIIKIIPNDLFQDNFIKDAQIENYLVTNNLLKEKYSIRKSNSDCGSDSDSDSNSDFNYKL